jgi:hypothetical protein
MRMLLLLVTLAIALPAGSVAQQYQVVGAGATTCGAWSANRRSNSQVWYVQNGWVLGFLSGVGFMGGGVTNPLRGLDADAVAGWLDNHCKAHPLENLATAAAAFVAEHPH